MFAPPKRLLHQYPIQATPTRETSNLRFSYSHQPTSVNMEKIKAKVEQVLHKGDHSTGTHTGTTGVHTGTTSTGQTTGVTGAHNAHSDPTGPHDSHVANKLDPRVD